GFRRARIGRQLGLLDERHHFGIGRLFQDHRRRQVGRTERRLVRRIVNNVGAGDGRGYDRGVTSFNEPFGWGSGGFGFCSLHCLWISWIRDATTRNGPSASVARTVFHCCASSSIVSR